MAGLDMTTFAAALKQHYVDFTVKNLVYKNNPLFALMRKYEKFGGLNMPKPLIYGNPQGRSATFSNALAQKTNSQVKAFTLTRVQDYSLANIQNEVLEASQADQDAFMRAATTEIDGAFHSVTRSIAQAMYRDGTGSIGVISAAAPTTSVQLATPADVVNFEIGMTLNFARAGVLSTGSVTISAVDRINGILTVSGSLQALITPAVTTGDVILVAGDFNKKLSGLDAWMPLSNPTSTPFFGVDRSVDPTRLGGVRKDIRNIPIEEGLIDLAMLIAREGGTPEDGFMNFQNYANLEKALGSKVIYRVVEDKEGVVGFEGIKIHGAKKPITIIPDHNCQADRVYLLQLDTWELASLGMAPKLLKSDGMEFLRVSTDDAVEVRCGAYLQMGCEAPGWSGVGQLA